VEKSVEGSGITLVSPLKLMKLGNVGIHWQKLHGPGKVIWMKFKL
jgi:hypothetical protein